MLSASSLLAMRCMCNYFAWHPHAGGVCRVLLLEPNSKELVTVAAQGSVAPECPLTSVLQAQNIINIGSSISISSSHHVSSNKSSPRVLGSRAPSRKESGLAVPGNPLSLATVVGTLVSVSARRVA